LGTSIHFEDVRDFGDQIAGDTQSLSLQPAYLSNQAETFGQRGELALFYSAVNNAHTPANPRQSTIIMKHFLHVI
jgi:hypothetical protein